MESTNFNLSRLLKISSLTKATLLMWDESFLLM